MHAYTVRNFTSGDIITLSEIFKCCDYLVTEYHIPVDIEHN